MPANRLAGETSPYLLQHAHNPVDWYPWGPEALERARAEDRPIFLSIGYAACHWCHVMERESFEDPATAALLNERFVAIKVDREERPDLDAVYMDAVAGADRLGRLADDRLPHARRPAVLRRHVLPERAARRAALVPGRARPGRRCLARAAGGGGATPRAAADRRSSRGPAPRGRRRAAGPQPARRGGRTPWRPSFDAANGGWGAAPKFPQPMAIELPAPAGRRRRRAGAGDGSAGRSTGWPRAGSTTSSAAGSPATARTRPGSCRTSRRCSTTTPCSPGSTSTPGADRRGGVPRRGDRRRSTSWPAS